MIEIVDPRTGELMDTDSVPGLAEVAAMLVAHLGELTQAVNTLQQEDAPRSDGKAPFMWADLPPRVAAREWRKLGHWVGWLRGRYPLARQVPVCWWRHPELVEEVTALWFAWREAYTEKSAPLTAAADWHGRWLPELLRRIGAGGWNVACEAEHKERVVGLYDAHGVDDPDAFGKFDPTGAMTEGPITEQARMDDIEMKQALELGEARTVGSLPGSPVQYLDGYWTQSDGASWVRIDDPAVTRYLTDAERRLELADRAVGDEDRS
jgi:hypothetical protein